MTGTKSSPIRNVIFDFGGVLIDWNPRYLYRSIFDSAEEMEHFLTTVCTPHWNDSLDAGTPFGEAVKLLQQQHPTYEKHIAAYDEHWATMMRGSHRDVVDILAQLKEAGWPLYGLTNWSHEKFPIALERFDFFTLFNGIVVSGAERLTKPNPKIYETLLERYGLTPQTCVFIDDSLPNVEAAKRLGMHALRFIDATTLRAQLVELGVL
jgi:2-haloacid dehalogenase